MKQGKPQQGAMTSALKAVHSHSRRLPANSRDTLPTGDLLLVTPMPLDRESELPTGFAEGGLP